MRSILLLLCLVQQTAIAEVEKSPAFASICVETEGTGFNWENGNWQQTSFVERTYVVRKIFPDEIRSESNSRGCLHSQKDEDFSFDDYAIVDGCYSRGTLGEQPFSSWCQELYKQSKAGDWSLISVDCSNAWLGDKITFQPNGPFIWHMVHTDVSVAPENNYKDSLKVSHGQCSIIE